MKITRVETIPVRRPDQPALAIRVGVAYRTCVAISVGKNSHDEGLLA